MTAPLAILLWALAAVHGPVVVRRCAPGEASALERRAIDAAGSWR